MKSSNTLLLRNMYNWKKNQALPLIYVVIHSIMADAIYARYKDSFKEKMLSQLKPQSGDFL
jgi:hypothetical protein